LEVLLLQEMALSLPRPQAFSSYLFQYHLSLNHYQHIMASFVQEQVFQQLEVAQGQPFSRVQVSFEERTRHYFHHCSVLTVFTGP